MSRHMYLHLLQSGGGLPVYAGHRQRGGRLNLGFLVKPFGKILGNLGKSLAKKTGKKLVEHAAAIGGEVLSGKTSLKEGLKKSARAGKQTLLAGAKDVLNEELRARARRQRGGGGFFHQPASTARSKGSKGTPTLKEFW